MKIGRGKSPYEGKKRCTHLTSLKSINDLDCVGGLANLNEGSSAWNLKHENESIIKVG